MSVPAAIKPTLNSVTMYRREKKGLYVQKRAQRKTCSFCNCNRNYVLLGSCRRNCHERDVSNVNGGILHWHLNGTMDDHLVPFDSCHHHAYVVVFKQTIKDKKYLYRGHDLLYQWHSLWICCSNVYVIAAWPHFRRNWHRSSATTNVQHHHRTGPT